MAIAVTPSGASCGATVRGLDLSKSLAADEIDQVRKAWLTHHVLAFPDQKLDIDQLEAFCRQFGELSEDPFFNPLPARKYTAAVKREATDTNRIFAEGWHSDWSFLESPPIGTVLYGVDIPPVGGDTHFSNQQISFESLPDEAKIRLQGMKSIHSSAATYLAQGIYGDTSSHGAMDIRSPNEGGVLQHTHPLILEHPETGRLGIFGGGAYIIGLEGVAKSEALRTLAELNAWQSTEVFVHKQKWEKNMLVMWDNRSVVHKATGGYEGYRRELHRVTVY